MSRISEVKSLPIQWILKEKYSIIINNFIPTYSTTYIKWIHFLKDVTQEEIVTPPNHISIEKIEFVFKSFQQRKSPGPKVFSRSFYQVFIEGIILTLYKLF